MVYKRTELLEWTPVNPLTLCFSETGLVSIACVRAPGHFGRIYLNGPVADTCLQTHKTKLFPNFLSKYGPGVCVFVCFLEIFATCRLWSDLFVGLNRSLQRRWLENVNRSPGCKSSLQTPQAHLLSTCLSLTAHKRNERDESSPDRHQNGRVRFEDGELTIFCEDGQTPCLIGSWSCSDVRTLWYVVYFWLTILDKLYQ